MKNTLLISLFVLSTTLLTSFNTIKENPVEDDIEWLDIEEAYRRAQTVPKKMMIDVYTDWCGWCKVMDRNTFSHPEIKKYLKENFYAVKLNAETKDSIRLGQQVFKYVASGRRGYNEIAAALLNNKLSYPTVVFMAENKDGVVVPNPIPGYQKPEQFIKLLYYFNENHYKTKSFQAFSKTFVSPIKTVTPNQKPAGH